MSHFWHSFFAHLKNCGRNATLFLIVLAGFVVLTILGAVIDGIVPHEYLVGGLSTISFGAVVWLSVGLYRLLTRRRERLRFPALSRDEIRVARSKLMKGRNAIGR
jgi:hypothetical protein